MSHSVHLPLLVAAAMRSSVRSKAHAMVLAGKEDCDKCFTCRWDRPLKECQHKTETVEVVQLCGHLYASLSELERYIADGLTEPEVTCGRCLRTMKSKWGLSA